MQLQNMLLLLVSKKIKFQFFLHLLEVQQMQFGFPPSLLKLAPETVNFRLQCLRISCGGRGFAHCY